VLNSNPFVRKECFGSLWFRCEQVLLFYYKNICFITLSNSDLWLQLYLPSSQTVSAFEYTFSCNHAVMGNTLYRVSDGPRSFVSEYLKKAIIIIRYLSQFVKISESESNTIVEKQVRISHCTAHSHCISVTKIDR
jgi:hypothetical protein